MTIVNPNNKKEKKTNRWVSGLIIALVVFSTFGVFLYNRMVGVKHDVENLRITLREAEVKNAELKNALYDMTKGDSVEAFLNRGILVTEKNPEYVKKQQFVANN